MSNKDNLDLAVNHAIGDYKTALLRMQAANPMGGLDAKRSGAWAEYGFKPSLEYKDFRQLYKRGGLARGAVDKIVGRCWKTDPWIIEGDSQDNAENETAWEKSLKDVLNNGRLWRAFKDADRRRLVGRYSGLILHIRDSKDWSQPVTGSHKLDKVTVAWAGSLEPTDLDIDPESETFGQPMAWQYTSRSAEAGVPSTTTKIHKDRIFILGDWQGEDDYFLEPSYNAFVSLEKVEGGSGEAFLKNAARQLSINFDKEVDLKRVATMYGVSVEDLQKRFNKAAEEINKGSDTLLITQGATTNPLVAAVPDPRPTYEINLQTAAAGVDIPVKILVGMQTGERASSEDEKYFNSRCQSRRVGLGFEITDFFEKLMDLGIIKTVKEFTAMWDDLTELTFTDRLNNAKIMADIVNSMHGYAEVYTVNEIREASGHDPRKDSDMLPDDDGIDDDIDGSEE